MKTIFVIDDDEKMRSLLGDVITVAGYEVRLFDNGNDAYQQAQKTPPDLIIVDEMLPQMDGFKFCGLIKSNARFQHIPVILFTAQLLEEQNKKKSEEAGVDLYMEKTGSVEKVVEVIEKFLSG